MFMLDIVTSKLKNQGMVNLDWKEAACGGEGGRKGGITRAQPWTQARGFAPCNPIAPAIARKR
jgi:hypothetical protein